MIKIIQKVYKLNNMAGFHICYEMKKYALVCLVMCPFICVCMRVFFCLLSIWLLLCWVTNTCIYNESSKEDILL